MADRYPGYDVLAKWDSPSFDAITRDVLSRRLHVVPKRRFFAEAEWVLVEALAALFLPQPERTAPIPIAPWIDETLAEGGGDGFRRDGEPGDGEVWRRGLASIDREARRRHGEGFVALDPARQRALLREIQASAVSDGWGGVAPRRFLVDVALKTMAGIYYSHPDAWSEIGFGGPASPRGYVRLQLDKHDPWEADEAK